MVKTLTPHLKVINDGLKIESGETSHQYFIRLKNSKIKGLTQKLRQT
jgi:hypothetical protein